MSFRQCLYRAQKCITNINRSINREIRNGNYQRLILNRRKGIIFGATALTTTTTATYTAILNREQTQNSKPIPTVLITGSSQGIGRGIAIELAKSNRYKLVLLSRNELKLNETIKECYSVNKNIEISTIISDITNELVIKSSIDKICATFGPLTCLINNAGMYYGGEIDSKKFNFEKLEKCINVNLTSTIKLCSYCIPYLKETKQKYPDYNCCIINIGSRAVTLRTCTARDSIYVATKSGLYGFAECLFHDLREYGIKVCSILPGWTNTPLIPPKHGREFHKMIQPIDIGKTVQYILDCNDTVCPIEIVLSPQRKCMPDRKPKQKSRKLV